jgi:hypothetical protein
MDENTVLKVIAETKNCTLEKLVEKLGCGTGSNWLFHPKYHNVVLYSKCSPQFVAIVLSLLEKKEIALHLCSRWEYFRHLDLPIFEKNFMNLKASTWVPTKVEVNDDRD